VKEKELYSQVGKRITAFRKQKGLTVQELADECDMEKSNLIPIEKGRINTTLSTLLKISKALGVPIKEFFE
jgi:transcriptional regulator with XRE-family HTH domain